MIVAVGALAQFTQGTVGQGFATYLGPLQAEFGWSRAVLAGPSSLQQAENAFLGPVQGYLVDRLGPRLNMALGCFVIGLGLILFGSTNSLPLFYLSQFVIAVGTSLQGLLVVSVAINQWFRRKRTMAQAIMLLGFSTAGVVGVPAVVFVQTAMGWRTSAVLTGLAVWAVGLPCSLLFCRAPEPYGLLPDGDQIGALAPTAETGYNTVAEYGFTLGEAVRTRAFWLLAFGQATGNLAVQAVMVHLFLHLEQGVGLSRPNATLIWTITSLTSIPSRLLGGYLGDRLPKNLVMGVAIAIMALSLSILALAGSFPMALAFAVLYGMGWGIRTPVQISIQGDYFGRKALGKIGGWLMAVSVPLSIAGPVVVGSIADIQGTYRLAYLLISIFGTFGGASLFLAAKPRPSAKKASAPSSSLQ